MSSFNFPNLIFPFLLVTLCFCKREPLSIQESDSYSFTCPVDYEKNLLNRIESINGKICYSFIDPGTNLKYVYFFEENRWDSVAFNLTEFVEFKFDNYIQKDSLIIIYNRERNTFIRQLGSDSLDYFALPENIELDIFGFNRLVLLESGIISGYADAKEFKRDIVDDDSLSDYFKRSSPVLLIQGDETIKFGKFPLRYTEGKVQDDLYATLCYRSNNNDILLSFSYCDSILKIDLNNFNEEWVHLFNPLKSKLSGYTTMQSKSMNYERVASVTKPKFLSHYYNTERELYFRLLYPGYSAKNEYLPSQFDVDYYYLIYDSDFNFLDSLKVEGERFNRDYFYTSDNSFYLIQDSDDNFNITITKYNL